jgi:hypothetical protein
MATKNTITEESFNKLSATEKTRYARADDGTYALKETKATHGSPTEPNADDATKATAKTGTGTASARAVAEPPDFAKNLNAATVASATRIDGLVSRFTGGMAAGEAERLRAAITKETKWLRSLGKSATNPFPPAP